MGFSPTQRRGIRPKTKPILVSKYIVVIYTFGLSLKIKILYEENFIIRRFGYGCFFNCCGSGKVTEFTHDIKNVKIKVDAPVTAGPNTIQAELKIDLDSVFKANKADRSKIKQITIEEFKFNMEDGRNFDNFESFTVNFFSDANDMTKLGIINPIEKGKTTIMPSVTEKANLSKYFSEASIFLIIDANLANADSIPVNMNADLK